MGEAFYYFLLELFSASHNQHLSPHGIVSGALANIGLALAYFWAAATLYWFTCKSILMKHSMVIYLVASLCILGGVYHVAALFPVSEVLQLALDFLRTIAALVTACYIWANRHLALSLIYQFKYVIGLLKTLDKLDEVDKP
jgi:hypothetical protein